MSLSMHASVRVDSVIKERSSNKSYSQRNVAGALYNDLSLIPRSRLMTLHLAWAPNNDFSEAVV